MKKLIGLVIVLAALIFGGYYEMGRITERTLIKNIAVMNQSSGLSVKMNSYHRGWYSSSAVLDWNFHIPAHPSKDQNGNDITVAAEDFSVNMPITIYHGPIILANSRLQFGLGYAFSKLIVPLPSIKNFEQTFSKKSTMPFLELSLFVDYFNNSKIQIMVPHFKLMEQNGNSELDWYGLTSHLTISSHLDNLEGGLDMDGAHFFKKPIALDVGKVSTDYDLHRSEDGLYLGNASIEVPAFSMKNLDKTIFDLQKFHVESTNDVQDGLFEASLKASLEKMQLQNELYGPAVLQAAIKNLDAKVLAQINAEANKLQQGTDAERQRAFLTILPQLPNLFSRGAQFEISQLSFVIPQGEVSGNLSMSLPKGDAGNPFQLLQKVQGNGTLKVPMDFVKAVYTGTIEQQLLSHASTAANASSTTGAAAPASNAATTKQATVVATTPINSNVTITTQPAAQQQNNVQPVLTADLIQQATQQAEQKLSTMVQNGLLVVQDKNYVIDVRLAEGQLTINGKPFTSAMVQF